MDEIARAEFAQSYIRRKRFEARLVASELARIFAGRRDERISSDALLGMMGVTIQ